MVKRYGLCALALFILYVIVRMDEANAPRQFKQQYECGDDLHDDTKIHDAVANGCGRVVWERKL